MFGIIFLTVELKGKFGDKVIITANWIPDSVFDAFHASFNVDVQEKEEGIAQKGWVEILKCIRVVSTGKLNNDEIFFSIIAIIYYYLF